MIALLLLTWTRLSVFPAPAEAQDSARPEGIVGFDQVVEFARRTAAHRTSRRRNSRQVLRI